MSKKTLLAIAAAITAIANDLDGSEAPAPSPEGAGGEAPAPRRGRPPKSATPPPEETPAPAQSEQPKAAASKSVEELRAAIKPLIEAARGAEVKALIKQHGGDALASIPVANQGAFVRDIEALLL